MTPTEKAVQLFNTYYVSILGINNDLSEEIIISILAKKHALIAVTEIINIYINFPKHPQSIYWQEVKQEIEKL